MDPPILSADQRSDSGADKKHIMTYSKIRITALSLSAQPKPHCHQQHISQGLEGRADLSHRPRQ